MTSLLKQLIQFLCIYQVVFAAGKKQPKLPSFVQICHRSDPELNECIRDSLDGLKEYIGDGIPELYIPPLEPLVIPEIKLDQDSGAIYLHSTFKNIHVHGLSNYVVDNLSADLKKVKLTMNMHFPKLRMEADYLMKGKIMMLPLVGDGQCSGNFTNVKLNSVITGRHFKKGKNNHIKVQNIKVEYKLGKANINLENLFNGDSALGSRMNRFLNENWNSLSDEIRPLMENSMSEIVRSSAEKIFATYSFDDLLPE